MKNKNRKQCNLVVSKLVILVVLIILFSLCGCESDYETRNPYKLKVKGATSDFYVNDFANMFTEEQKDILMARAVNMDEEYSGIQVVVTIINSFDEVVIWENEEEKPETFAIEEVAYSMYNQYGIGKEDMGILILFSVGDREVKIETGFQMQAYITDSLSREILDDYGMDYFVNDKFADGIISVQDAVINKIEEKVPKDWIKEIVLTPIESNSDSTIKEETKEKDNSEIVAGSKNDGNNNGSITSSDNLADSTNKSSGKGLVAGFFASIVALITSIILSIRKSITGKVKLETMEKKIAEELDTQKNEFEIKILGIEKDSQLKIEAIQTKSQKEQLLLKEEIAKQTSKYNSLKSKFDALNEKYLRICKLHPELNFDAEISEMIVSELKEKAASVDSKLIFAINTSASKDNVDVFKNAIVLYNNTDSSVKEYVTSDIQVIKKLYDESVSLQKAFLKAEQERKDKEIAYRVYNEVNGVYNSYTQENYKTYEIFRDAYQKVQRLTSAQLGFFPDKYLIESLKRKRDIAKKDYDNFNEVRRVERDIHSIVDYIYSPDEDDKDKLERAMRYYRSLNMAQQAYFSTELLHKLKRMISIADDDHRHKEAKRRQEREERERQEKEERQRRMNSLNHSSSIHRSSSTSRSSFSGHGGRSSGGGASRKF